MSSIRLGGTEVGLWMTTRAKSALVAITIRIFAACAVCAALAAVVLAVLDHALAGIDETVAPLMRAHLINGTCFNVKH